MENKPYKRLLLFVVAGALLGAVLTSWLAPKVIAWYFSPPAQMGFNCEDPIRWALRKLQISQMVGTVAGVIGGLVVGYVFRPKNPLDPI